MPKRTKSEEEEEEGTSNSTSSESEQTVRNSSTMSEYEKQRLKRIAENQARLKAMGLPQMVTSLKKSTPIKKKNKGKEKVEDDEEYKPESEEEREHESDSDSSSEEQHEHDSDFEIASGSRKRKAIALSLQDSAEASFCSNKNVGNISKAGKNENILIQEDKGRKKNKKSFTSRLQMTEDELIVHFFQLDEAGKGTVTKRDLERAAIAHDFAWTDKELVDMIRCFDSDRDGKLSLDDFRKIVVRCNMIKGSENS
ncbi:hypothetical protein TSUD_266200 [Trifolium subterraneum]|uniref:EF-hand domain-containing protein n=1 Tax=Trifolium subterraneum TaxID=3900 RepID=A0A2Z6M6B2_TRISU|nr:hypothetical protein TSUD_266200 [Trifolium subterraneum]